MTEKHTLIADDGSSLTLPVTPLDVPFPTGKDYKVLNIVGLGEYIVPGHKTLGNICIPDLLIPAQRYPFCVEWTEQSAVLAWLERMATERRRLRYIVTGRLRPVSWPCYLVSIEPAVKDGTKDIYVKAVFQEWQPIATPVSETKKTVRRDDPLQEVVTQEKTYTVKAGDNLWTICRTYYSDGSVSSALATYNGIANPNIIFAGQVLKVPPKASLLAGASK